MSKESIVSRVSSPVRTGLAPFDEVTGGIRPGQLWMHAGCIGDLKSTWALNWALNGALAGANVAFKSFERSSADVTRDFVALCKGMNARKVRQRELTTTEICTLRQGLSELRQGELTPGRFEAVTLEEPVRMQDLARTDVDVMIIDSAYMMACDPTKGLEVICRDAKRLSLGSFGGNPMGVVLIQQLSRDWPLRFAYSKGFREGAFAHVDVITTSFLDQTMRRDGRALFRMLRNGHDWVCAEPFFASVDRETRRISFAGERRPREPEMLG